MTKQEVAVHRDKIKKVMVDHLTSLGYPNVEYEIIMRELKNMYVKIEESGLILPGMTYHGFQQIANTHFMMAQMQDMMGLSSPLLP